MEQFSISFTLGKGTSPHGGNIDHNNRAFLAKNVHDIRSPLNVVFARNDIEIRLFIHYYFWEINQKKDENLFSLRITPQD